MAQAVHSIAGAALAVAGGILVVAASFADAANGSVSMLTVVSCVGATGLALWTAQSRGLVRRALPVRARARAGRRGRVFE